MARNPTAKARITGAAARNPSRYRGRNDPTAPLLDRAPAYFDKSQKACFRAFQAELPWLIESDRALVEMASVMRARFRAGLSDGSVLMGINQFQVYSALLSKLGATPTDRSRTLSLSDEDDDDDEFFGRSQ